MKISRIIFDSEVRLFFFQCLQTPVLQEAKQRPIISPVSRAGLHLNAVVQLFLSMVENQKDLGTGWLIAPHDSKYST